MRVISVPSAQSLRLKGPAFSGTRLSLFRCSRLSLGNHCILARFVRTLPHRFTEYVGIWDVTEFPCRGRSCTSARQLAGARNENLPTAHGSPHTLTLILSSHPASPISHTPEQNGTLARLQQSTPLHAAVFPFLPITRDTLFLAGCPSLVIPPTCVTCMTRSTCLPSHDSSRPAIPPFRAFVRHTRHIGTQTRRANQACRRRPMAHRTSVSSPHVLAYPRWLALLTFCVSLLALCVSLLMHVNPHLRSGFVVPSFPSRQPCLPYLCLGNCIRLEADAPSFSASAPHRTQARHSPSATLPRTYARHPAAVQVCRSSCFLLAERASDTDRPLA